MSDEELITFLRTSTSASLNKIAADRIEALVKERDAERSKRNLAEGLAGLASADIDGHSAMIDVARDAIAKRIEAEARAERLAATNEALAADREALITARDMMGRQWAKDAEARLAAEARAERLEEALQALEKVASEVSRRGAETGPQWSKLTIAILKARAALKGADHE